MTLLCVCVLCTCDDLVRFMHGDDGFRPGFTAYIRAMPGFELRLRMM